MGAKVPTCTCFPPTLSSIQPLMVFEAQVFNTMVVHSSSTCLNNIIYLLRRLILLPCDVGLALLASSIPLDKTQVYFHRHITYFPSPYSKRHAFVMAKDRIFQHPF